MATNHSTTVVPRVSPEVGAFAAARGVADCLPQVLEMTRRVFLSARRMDVFVEEDAEIPEDQRIIIEVDAPLPVPDAVAAQHRWTHAIFQCCPSTHSWVFVLGMNIVE
jgi:hypothetical protein